MKINEKDTKQGIFPALRFPEFDNHFWDIKELSKIANLIKERARNGNYTPMSVTSGVGLISQKEKFGRNISGNQYSSYFVIRKGDFAYNKSATNLYPEGYISMLKNFEIAAVPNSIFTCFRVNRKEVLPEYLDYLFENNYHGKWLRKFIEVGARAHGSLSVDAKKLFELPIVFPSISEQQKIADCLSSIDALIKAAENKIDELKAHKKGLMQQLFPADGETVPALRFPEFQDAGEWEEILMHQIGKMFSGLSGKNSSDFGRGKRYITYKQVYSDTVNDFDKCEKVLVRESEKQHYVQKGDILFTTSSETPNEVGISSVILESLSETIYLNSFCFILRPYDINKLYPKFARYLFRSQIYRNRINKLAQGAIRFNLSRNQFIKLSLPIPRDLKEQQKVADCLSSIDDLIAVQTNRLEALRNHKKGLVQQLFPNLNNHEE